MQPTLSPADFVRESAIVAKADAYARATMGSRNYLTAEEAAHPDYAACNNAMRGRVEQFRVLSDPPAELVAYTVFPDGARETGSAQPCRVTTWTGDVLGTAHVTARWRVESFMGSYMYQFRATIAGREYTGRGFGNGAAVRLRETTASKHRRGA